MNKLEILNDKLKDLKLQKRTLLLLGKSTKEIDIAIKDIETTIKEENK